MRENQAVHFSHQRVAFVAPRRHWRWIVVVLFGACSILFAAYLVVSPDSDFALGSTAAIVVFPLWLVSLFGTLIACLSRFIQIRQNGSGLIAWMDPEGIHIKNGQAISWPDVQSVFTRRAPTGELLLCIRPGETGQFIAHAPTGRREEMQSNLDKYEAPLFINLSAFWQGSTDDLAKKIGTLTSGRLTLESGA